MKVLSVLHGANGRTELFAPVVREHGHRLDEWSFVWGTRPPLPLAAYDAVLVLGGSMHADQESAHPWLHEELHWLQDLLARRVPTLGICLGVQLLARAGGGWVGPLPEPEIGWVDVELTEAGAADPVLGVLPRTLPRCSGTTTRTASPTARSSSRAALRRRRRSGSATPAGASSSTRR